MQQIHIGIAPGRMAPATSILVIDNTHIRNPDGCIAPTTLGKQSDGSIVITTTGRSLPIVVVVVVLLRSTTILSIILSCRLLFSAA